MKNYQKSFIELSLQAEALQFGNFTLKSGRQSPYFFNLGKLSSAMQLDQLGHYYATLLQELSWDFDTLFGPAYKGIPIATSTAVSLARDFQRDARCVFDRKETKDHGEGGMLIGTPGHKAVILDDVITAGTAIRHTIKLLNQINCHPVGIIVALDRQEKGKTALSSIHELEQEFGIPVKSLITLTDLIEYMRKSQISQPFVRDMEGYRETFGC